ncbi:MarR family winged helix-turn-helix transcriptional regulator [Georgenia sp. Z1344]|uniref:MarR family winged helix-turn-helix transcriptional regulator n=1 Tax=Georgenia sp. Z1344 TaxID=3416706 RepID=UPI003CE9072A
MRDRVSDYLGQWREQRPELELAPMSVTGRVSRASDLISQGMREFFAEHDLQPGEYDVLSALRRAGDPFTLTPGALTGSMMVTAAAMTNRLSRLEEKGLVDRSTDPDNRRSVRVSLTPRGRAVIDDVAPRHVRAEGDLLAALDDAELAQLAGLLEKLLAGLGDRSQHGDDDAGDGGTA